MYSAKLLILDATHHLLLYWKRYIIVVLLFISFVTVDSRLSASLTHVVNCFFFFFKLMNVHQPLVRTELLARRLRIATTVSHVQQDGRGKTAMKVLCNSIVWQGSTIN